MKSRLLVLGTVVTTVGCMSAPIEPPRIPAVEYSRRLKQEARAFAPQMAAYEAPESGPNARYRAVATTRDSASGFEQSARARFASDAGGSDPRAALDGFKEFRSQRPNERDYNGPLPLGDPGSTASLWRESSGGNDMFRDSRAFAPFDLITIVVTERTKAAGSADTEVKEAADISASIPNLLGLESTLRKTNPQIDLTKLITAAATNNFKGEGTTNREGTLSAKISAVVVEVLPGGLLRIEGEKIISLNSEEQNLVLSGLVRTRDISSSNEVDSGKIANLRIDYFGKGIVGEAQNGGWLSRLVRRVWPF